jgi:large subunit ribosomal protein L31
MVSDSGFDSDANYFEVFIMKQGIHPEYAAIQATCSCGNVINVGSTLAKSSLALDVCSACHPFYTGKQKEVSSGGRVDRFNKRFGALGSKK